MSLFNTDVPCNSRRNTLLSRGGGLKVEETRGAGTELEPLVVVAQEIKSKNVFLHFLSLLLPLKVRFTFNQFQIQLLASHYQ